MGAWGILSAFFYPLRTMATRLLQLDDLRQVQTPDKIASLFHKLGYNARSSELDVRDLELPARSTEAVWKSYLIANQGKNELQVLLFHLHPQEFSSPSVASNRMRSIASSLCKRPSNFLLLGTQDYNQLMLVNPRKSFDEQMNLKVGIRKLLIDRTNPTNYDRDRLEAIAAHHKNPQELYQAQCEAFDVEKLTKQFFKGYKSLFDRVQQIIKQHNHHSYFESQDRLHQFSQRLLGRIMFLYFLQKKEFLASDRKFLTTQYQKLKLDTEDTDFYINVLEPLFFETLNKDRPDMESPWGKIPYLNGGLFNRDYGEESLDATGLDTPEKIEIPNSLFDPGESNSVLNFFNSYNFTVAENVEGDEDVAVDPEMLGKVFENMLEVEERGKSGTFYTPRGIVHFMCSEVLARYLSDETGMDLETVKKIIEFDPEQPANYFKELISPQQAKKLKLALQSLKCLDPAVGSAAFPMGMMQVILAAYQSIAQREGNPIKRGSLAMSRLKRNIIANNLYGVDIKPEAIEIAKLRMWLSLVVDIPDIDDVEPLPNLEYKLMCGDSLISTINGEVLIPDPVTNKEAIQLQLEVTPIQQAIQPLFELQQQYFDVQIDERAQLKKKILEAEANIFRVAIAERHNFWTSEQQKLNKTISSKSKLTKNTELKKAAIAAQLSELDKLLINVENRKRSLSFFQYYLHFRDVFEVKGGFDVVIGNPPYVRQEQIKELKPALKEEYECYTGVADLYVYFFEKGYRLLKSGGALTYISSNKYFRSGYGEKLRKYLGEQATVQHLIDFGDASVFEAIAYPSIIQVSKAKPENHQTLVLNWDAKQCLRIKVFTSLKKN
jgi:adenine-specific DNA-methyltransferase